jgi:hypothetical protein
MKCETPHFGPAGGHSPLDASASDYQYGPY